MKSACKMSFRLGSRTLGLAMVAAGALTLIPWVFGQDAGPAALAARLSDVQGQVQLTQGNQVLASQAPLNAPLFEGSQISTSDDGRAEIEFQDGSVARVPPNSSLVLSVLRQQGNSTQTEVVLQSGLGYFELQGNTATAHTRVRFGNNVVTSSGFTVLRVDLDNPPGDLAVFSGNAHLDGGNGQAVDMHGGESLAMSADADNWTLNETIEPDSWDAWNSDRDQALTAQEANRTTATNSQPDNSNPAWSDLDSNGNWYDVPGQGYVWSPYEAQNAGWDPYAYGDWMWTPGFGYGWVSSEPWGFMPYQMGMWNYYNGFGWGWMPGGPMCWGNGGWAANVGSAPLRYQPPLRPRGGPVMPGQGGMLRTGGNYQPYPMVAVNHLRESIRGGPVRANNTPVTIAGNTVQPLRPLAPRAVYDHTYSTGFRPQQGMNAGMRGAPKYGYVANPVTGYGPYGNRPGTWNTQRSSAGSTRQPVYNGTRSSAPYRGTGSRPSASGRPSAPSHGSYGGGAPAGHASGGSFGGGSHGGGGGHH